MITENGINKIANAIKNLAVKVRYKLDGKISYINIQQSVISGDVLKFYILFSIDVIGTISDIEIVDEDNNALIKSTETYSKTTDKALWVTFKYLVSEISE